MRKEMIPVIGLLAVAASANADVIVKFPAGASGEYEVESLLVSDAVKPRGERPAPVVNTLSAGGGEASFNILPGGMAQSMIFTSEREAIPVFTLPGDDIVVEITSMEPLEYTVSGTPLMSEISSLDKKGDEIKKKYYAIARSSAPDQTEMEQLASRYDLIYADYVKQYKDSPAAVYALIQLDGQGFLDMYEVLGEGARQSGLFPLAENKKARVVKSMEQERRLQALQTGDVDAPAFTLPDLQGKMVSLSDFRGKWVILDFWGSWCPWCIKGFPALKEVYANKEYAGRLEIIGIDCRDSEDVWKAAVARYELPWVQVYNGGAAAESLYEAYAVQGFPTKVIVSPEGKIVNITVGEDPAFFTKLTELMK